MQAFSLTSCILLSTWLLSCNGFPSESKNLHSENLKNSSASHSEDNDQLSSNCRYLDLKDVEFHTSGYVLIKAFNITMSPRRSYITVDNVRICFNRSEELKRKIFSNCYKWIYEEGEFEVLKNGSVILFSLIPQIMEPGTYESDGMWLYTCTADYDDYVDEYNLPVVHNKSEKQRYTSIIFGNIGSSISVVALTAHLIIFCMVPPLRNLPGYNLASLSVAFLIAFACVIVGQMPSVVGLSCEIVGILQLNCFLVAFFCMNVMAFDVWRTVRLATLKLVVSSVNKKRTQFIMYTIYSWGVPLLITATAVVLDYVEGVPLWLKAGIGNNDMCCITNKKAKLMFFIFPAFTLFVANGVFFVLSAVAIKKNTMKNTNAQYYQSIKLNFVLYVKLGLMIGVTWLFSVLATITDNNIVWLISDFLNPLQGLFIFILFTCSRKVIKYVKQRIGLVNLKNTTTEKKSHSSSVKSSSNSSTATTREAMFSSPSH